jgi:hypothetical protein
MDLFDPDHDGILQDHEFIAFIRKSFEAMRGNQDFWVLYVSVIVQPRVKELLAGKPFISAMDKFGPMLMDYFSRKGFEDPALEMLTFSAMIEGFGVLLIYDYPGMNFSDELLQRFEDRIIEMYT